MKTRVQDLACVTYHWPSFDPEKFVTPFQPEFEPKPKGGLWASPVGSQFSWKDWCEGQDFAKGSLETSFSFELTGTVLMIDSEEDVRERWPVFSLERSLWVQGGMFINFQEVFDSGEFDAIWLTEDGQRRTRLCDPPNLYGWDCETVFIINPEACRF